VTLPPSLPPDDRNSELMDLFFETSQELLQALNEEALQLEKNPGDEEIVRSIRRTVHTLKGDSAACGLRELSELAHHFENALNLEGTAGHTALAEIAFAAADVFTAMLASYHGGSPMPATEGLRRKIDELTAAPAAKKSRKRKPTAPARIAKEKGWTPAEKLLLTQAHSSGLALYEIVVKIDPHCSMPIAARQLVQNAISELGQVIAVRPDLKSPTAARLLEIMFGSAQSKQEIAAKCQIPTIVDEVSVTLVEAASAPKLPAKIPAEPDAPSTPVVSSAPATPVQAEGSATSPETAPQALMENILRVDAGRIDNVLNLVGELIIGKSMLQQTLGEFNKRYPKEMLRGKFADAMAFQSRVLNDLQRAVMKIRMVPVEQLFRRFPRIARDVARQCGREVDLELSGQETDLDKGILDAIAEPLTHLLRNAISHGIETADERVHLGKPPRGTIRLHAFHQGNQVMVEIADDGRGIDASRILAKAIALGMVTAEEAARLTEAQTLEFIFRPGFSTAAVVTEVSGRGVGMDVVQTVLHRLKATIQIETRLGRGTTFRLKLPLTLAIIKALMFWVEGRLYAIPLNAVSQIARSTEADVHQVDNYEVLQLRNQVLPLLRLGRPAAADERRADKLFVLVITVREKKYGLIVDALEGEEELVIKALDSQTFSTDLVNGASILGDGKVVLILNLPAVVEHHARSRPQEPGLESFGVLMNQADRARFALTASGGKA
jgi:two-component system chemotaxis sensor kinase CheA